MVSSTRFYERDGSYSYTDSYSKHDTWDMIHDCTMIATMLHNIYIFFLFIGASFVVYYVMADFCLKNT